MPGLLRVHGTIDLSQFWPKGSSDADTTKIRLTIEKGSFEFRPEGGTKFTRTNVFDTARVKAKGVSPAVKVSKKTGERSIVVRLQGIDAPELHYRPTMPDTPKPTPAQRKKFNAHNDELRQVFGETCTVALHARLAKIDPDTIDCVMESAVDAPGDVCDMYGRFVGDLKAATAGNPVHVNRWLLANGWALPAFYNSMTNDEIISLSADTAKGRKKGRVWDHYTPVIEPLDEELRYRPGGPSDAGADTGDTILPKLFRRFASYSIADTHTSQKLPKTFAAFVATGSGNEMHQTGDFLLQGATAATTEHLGDHIVNNTLDLEPEQIVFREKASILIDEAGEPIVKW